MKSAERYFCPSLDQSWRRDPSTYVLFAESTINQIDFLAAIADRTGCGLLVDVNNVMVFSIIDRPTCLYRSLSSPSVGEIHLAGYDETDGAAGVVC